MVEHRLTTCEHPVEVASWDGHITCADCGHVRIAPLNTTVMVGHVTDVRQLRLTGVHPESSCAEQSACAMHNPTDHHMRGWEVIWRYDRGILERICQHGIGHPDPDQFPYWDANGMEAEAVHGCDLCCHASHKPADQNTI
jgi:hypothetical protein